MRILNKCIKKEQAGLFEVIFSLESGRLAQPGKNHLI